MARGAGLAALAGIVAGTQRQVAAISLGWQGNGTLEEIDPSRYPEFVQWLESDIPAEGPVLSRALEDGRKNKGPPHFPDLQSYMDRCQAVDPEVVEIPTWMGRMGNRIWQVLNAVRIAEATGRKFVRIPRAGGGLDHHLFGSPEGRLIEVTPPEAPGTCDFIPVSGKMHAWHHDCRFLFFNRCRTTVKERMAAYNRYIMPIMRDDIMDRCKAGADDEVTIHIRNGDVALHIDTNPEMRPEHRQPPCAYFHKVIQTGHNGSPFKRVQLVYSNEEPTSPCIDDILEKHKDKVILRPAPAVPGDVCHILRAKNLATTMSSFATVLKMMNTGLQRLFFANMLSPKMMTKEQYEIQMDYYEFRVNELCDVFPEVTSYSVPELYLDEGFFLRFPDGNIVVDSCRGDPKGIAALREAVQATTSVAMKKRRRWSQ